MNLPQLMGIPMLMLGAAAITETVVPEGSQLDTILGEFIDVGLVGAIAVMFYLFWRMSTSQNTDLQGERLEELKRQRDAALEERDLWYEQNMKQYQDRLATYQAFIESRGVVVNADDIIHPDDITLHIEDGKSVNSPG